jgi:hypothetical protein
LWLNQFGPPTLGLAGTGYLVRCPRLGVLF